VRKSGEELDYLQQPDIFHELFGHAPLLMNQHYSDFMQWYGQVALPLTTEARKILSRLFWFTVEFGLMHTDQGLRIYGGGILSSFQETVYSLESSTPKHTPFDAPKVLKTPYRYDQIQKEYFFLEGGHLSALFDLQHNPDVLHFLQASFNGPCDQKPFVTC
jgi:phenylalanine-4-hydroxylase